MASCVMTACPECRKHGHDKEGDNLGVYDDGVYCFRCGYTDKKENVTLTEQPSATKPKREVVTSGLVYEPLPHRGLTQETCEAYGLATRVDQNGDKWEFAHYYDDNGKLQAQKVRRHGTFRNAKTNVDKKLFTLGDGKDKKFFGKHMCRKGGKILVITEGEYDAASYYEATGRKYGAVSLPDGAASAVRTISNDIEYVNSFERVILMFDMDDEGRQAAVDAAGVLRPGKAYIASLPMKDANECLLARQKKVLADAVWTADPYRPDGIVHVSDVQVMPKSTEGKIYMYPFPSITKATYGRRCGDLNMITSGSGMGKSTLVRRMMHYDLEAGENVGAIMLEERISKTKQDIMSIQSGKPIHKILASRVINSELAANGMEEIDFGTLPELSDEEFNAAKAWIDEHNLFLYDHFGSIDLDVLMKRIEYLHYACGCQLIYLDHVSIVVSGGEGDERRDLDRLMTTLKSLAERTGVCITAVCHLKKPNGQPFEEGGQISLNDLRGSGALYQLADTVLGLERNQQHEDQTFANTIGVRLLKDRFDGNTGLKAALAFDRSTHTLRSGDLDWYKAMLNATKRNNA